MTNSLFSVDLWLKKDCHTWQKFPWKRIKTMDWPRGKKSIRERVNWWFASLQARVGPREAQVRKANRATIGQHAWGATAKPGNQWSCSVRPPGQAPDKKKWKPWPDFLPLLCPLNSIFETYSDTVSALNLCDYHPNDNRWHWRCISRMPARLFFRVAGVRSEEDGHRWSR